MGCCKCLFTIIFFSAGSKPKITGRPPENSLAIADIYGARAARKRKREQFYILTLQVFPLIREDGTFQDSELEALFM